MLDSILNAVKGQAIEAMAGKGILPAQAEQAVPLAGESIQEGLMGAATSGNFGGISDLLSLAGGGADTSGLMGNPIFKSILGGFAGKMVSKLGIGSGIANTVAGAALPMILGKLGGETTKDGGGLDLGAITKLVGGGAAGAAGGALGGLADQAKGMLGGILGGK